MELDDRRLRWLLWVALGLVGLGLWFFVLRGADQPADPELGELIDGAMDGGTSTLPGNGPVITATTFLPLTSAPTTTRVVDGVDAPGDPDRVPLDGFGEMAVAIDPGDGRGLLAWCLLAARNAEERSRGMIGVEDLQGYSGMVFIYQEDTQNSYHMRGVPMPLSIGWFAADGLVVATSDMEPCLGQEICPSYSSGAVYRFSIEVPQGRLDDLGIVEGSRLRFLHGGCAARS